MNEPRASKESEEGLGTEVRFLDVIVGDECLVGLIGVVGLLTRHF
jgi:hypothetical protein